MGWALGLATVTGFIALAYEVVWIRLASFGSGSRPPALGALLGCYLLGLGLGSILSRRWQPGNLAPDQCRQVLARLLLGANLVCFLAGPLGSWILVAVGKVAPLSFGTGLLSTFPLVVVGAALLGCLFPLISHFSIAPDERAGARLSYLYVANILGSGMGSLLTGFILMDHLRLWQITGLLLALGLAASLLVSPPGRNTRLLDLGLLVAAIGLSASSELAHRGIYERLQYKGEYRADTRFTQVVESKHGVITVDSHRKVFGNGAYDGFMDTAFSMDNGMVRPYFVSALHPEPREILVIGVSCGNWTQVLACHPQVEQITAIEISRGYLEVIRANPEVAGLLANPKVNLIIDDGRRWLRRHPDRRFDVIVMNTTFHWREYASALLSREFLELTKRHLKPGGWCMWNGTGSARAIRTGLDVFPETMMVLNNCVGSLTPLRPDAARLREALARYRVNGQRVLDPDKPADFEKLRQVTELCESFGRIKSLPGLGLMARPEMVEEYGAAAPITDDNLGHEY